MLHESDAHREKARKRRGIKKRVQSCMERDFFRVIEIKCEGMEIIITWDEKKTQRKNEINSKAGKSGEQNKR
jgi:hypothetical protein